ncbi:MAG: ribulokinase [Solirubrobacteraceae bacterium]
MSLLGHGYSIGIDFGTESGRALLLDLDSGGEVASIEVRYARGVLDEILPGTGEQLPPDWALQDPDDWIAVVNDGVGSLLAESGISRARVRGIGVDFTSCTVLPVTADGAPLCSLEKWRSNKHAWPKLWKHHAAQPVADRLTDVAEARSEPFLQRYGGRISSEWYFPKLIELWLEDRDVYDGAAAFVEATDWIVWWLTGRECRQLCTAGYKALWSPDTGLPSLEYFTAAYPGFDEPAAKLGATFVPLGSRAGTLRAELASRLGLSDAVAVAVGNVDSFVSVPGAGVDRPGAFVTVVGTSTCDMVVDQREVLLPGITGVLKDGIIPGLYGYEAGQAAVGDMLAWMIHRIAPTRTYAELERAASEMGVGETGLVALDWWNGNRTILADADLTGAIFGLTLTTTIEQLYRALLESIAFGNRRIMENFEEHGLPLQEIVACGGIAHRSPLLMQILADTSGRPVYVPASREIPARGAALFGAVAAGVFASIGDALEATRVATAFTYRPDANAKTSYDEVYAIYRDLYDTHGRERAEHMHRLKAIRANARSHA